MRGEMPLVKIRIFFLLESQSLIRLKRYILLVILIFFAKISYVSQPRSQTKKAASKISKIKKSKKAKVREDTRIVRFL